jgi:hypothetical protein
MKKTLIFSVFVMLFSFAQAQNPYNWIPLGATWYYSTPSAIPWEMGFGALECNKDTIVGSDTARVIPAFTASSFNASTFVIHNNNHLYYMWLNNSFELVYDFSAQVGDSFPASAIVQYNYLQYDFPCTIAVKQVDSVFVNGQFVSIQHTYDYVIDTSLLPLNIKEVQFTSLYLENRLMNSRWGAMYIYYGFVPGIPYLRKGQIPSHNGGESFRCYTDDVVTYNYPNWTRECDYSSVGVDKINKSFKTNLFPNPTTTHFTLQSTQNINRIQVFDLRGALVLEQNVQSTEHQVQLSEAGTYIIHIHLQDGSTERQKVVKMRE